jgi:hypothetical protein
MKLVNMKKLCMLVCAVAFSSSLFADGLDSSQVVAQQQQQQRNKNSNGNGKADKNASRDPNTWKPYYLKTKNTEPLSCFYQQTVGIGFLYFSGIKGNLNVGNSNSATLGTPGFAKSDTKLSGHLGYNRTPVSEFIIGTDIWHWFKIAMSYTHQGGIVVQTSPQARATLNNLNPDLTAHVRLDAALFRVYFMFPYTLVWKNVYYEPYLSAGVGPGWQTWADIKSEADFTNALRMKVSSNCVFTIDLGSKIRRAMPTYVMSFTLGCKYTEWGQARSMGKLNQQYAQSAPTDGTNRQFLSNPLRITTVYSFAPYVGVQFNY